MRKPTCILLMAFAALTGCGRDAGRSAAPKSAASGQTAASGQAAAPGQAAMPRLIHSPPIAQLSPEQLRSLSMECEKYSPDKSSRGPYDAAYCEDAIAAWADSPLQIVPIPINKDEAMRNSPASRASAQ
jgi:hypothetical protein